jgi:CDP-diacylglycerol--serine O-phosphatidyltransferase
MMGASGKIRQSGVFLLPNLLTTSALFAGFYSIIAGINGKFAAAAIAVVVAGVLDGLDGRVARLTNTQSDFGQQYDSLCDLVSFGLAPALLAFNWSLRSLADYAQFTGKLGWLAAFVYVSCAALRLARFNTKAEHDDKRYFQGLASPAAAGTLVTTIWFFVDNGIAGETVNWLIFFETMMLGVLMFSQVRYYSFKTWSLAERVPLAWIFMLVLLIALLAIDPPAVMMTLGIVYVISGIVITMAGRRNWKSRRARRLARRLPRHRKAGAGEEEPGSKNKAA